MEHKLYTLTVKTFKFRINFFHFFTLQIWKPTIFIDILKKLYILPVRCMWVSSTDLRIKSFPSQYLRQWQDSFSNPGYVYCAVRNEPLSRL